MTPEDIQHQIRSKHGLVLQVGPYKTSIHSEIPKVVDGVSRLYSDFIVHHKRDQFIDFHIQICKPKGLRGWYRSQAHFYLDQKRPFKPLPLDHAYAFFEWGLNWCITQHSHQYLIVHAAVVEKNGFALILPGAPGAGKSTLCAGLVARGWRLLSDELTMFPQQDASRVVPVPRPIGLKNQSIDVMKAFAPNAVFGQIAYDTSKGTVSHIKPSSECVKRAHETALPALVVFPRYQSDSDSQLRTRTKASSFMEMARQSFNYNVLGESGFDRLVEVITRCDCYDFQYSDLDDGIRIMNELVAEVSDRRSGGRARA